MHIRNAVVVVVAGYVEETAQQSGKISPAAGNGMAERAS